MNIRAKDSTLLQKGGKVDEELLRRADEQLVSYRYTPIGEWANLAVGYWVRYVYSDKEPNKSILVSVRVEKKSIIIWTPKDYKTIKSQERQAI